MLIPLRGRNHKDSDGSSSRAGIKGKAKRAKIVVLLGCAFLATSNSLNKTTQRQMKCAASKFDGRNLSVETEGTSNNVSFKDFILCLLETAVEDPCNTEYPPTATDEVAYASDSPEANMEPDYTITDLDPIPPIGVDGNYDVAPPPDGEGLDGATMDETQKDLLDTFPLETYDEERALLSETTDDAVTIAYCVALTGCAEWYDPANNALLTTDQTTTATTDEGTAPAEQTTDTTTATTTGDISVPAEQTTDTATTTTITSTTTPDQGAEVYEDAAILKTNICENNEIAVSRALKRNEERWDTERKLATDLGYQM